MHKLLESFFNGNMVEINKLFEQYMEEILAKKLYEIKRSISLHELTGYHKELDKEFQRGPYKGLSPEKKKEVYKQYIKLRKGEKDMKKQRYTGNTTFGSKSPSEIEQMKKAGAKRASDVYGDPQSGETKPAKNIKAKGTPGLSSKPPIEPKIGYKRLAPIGSVRPKSLSIGDRYERDLAHAQDLESRGSHGKVKAIKKAFRGYRAGTAIGSGISKAIDVWGNVLNKSTGPFGRGNLK